MGEGLNKPLFSQRCLQTFFIFLSRAPRSFSQARWCFQKERWEKLNNVCVQATGGPSSLHEHGRDSCLQVVLCYKRIHVFTKAWKGCKQLCLKEKKNVMFLNKVDVPYCLVVFFVVYLCLRPFWGVFGKLALFWCSTAKRKTRQNSDSRRVRHSRRIIPLKNDPRPQFFQKFKAEMLQFHVHSLDSQFLPQIVH